MTNGRQSRIETDVRIACNTWLDRLPEAETLLRRAVDAAAVEVDAEGEAAVLLTDSADMRTLNHRWRGVDKPTDVLAFPSSLAAPPGQPIYLGDIAIGLETAEADAARMQRPLDFHAAHLVVHGFLHLMGYDHHNPEEAERMEGLERSILAGLGWPDPYLAYDEGLVSNDG